jgi:hypothetical protein
MRLDTRLTRGKTPAEIKELEDRYRNSLTLLAEISRVLTNEIEDGTIGVDDEEIFKGENALVVLSGRAGERRALRRVLALLNPYQ